MTVNNNNNNNNNDLKFQLLILFNLNNWAWSQYRPKFLQKFNTDTNRYCKMSFVLIYCPPLNNDNDWKCVHFLHVLKLR